MASQKAKKAAFGDRAAADEVVVDALTGDDCAAQFATSWKSDTPTTESGCQTSEVVTTDKDTQSIASVSVECQTDEIIQDEIVGEEDGPELAAFLARVEEDVSAQLLRNAASHAFEGYEVTWDEATAAVSCLHTLHHAELKGEGLECTAVSWNASGSVVLVGYGRHDIEGFCTYRGFVCTWNVDRRNLNPEKADVMLEFPSCVTSLKAHPKMPGVSAVGTFNGVIYLVDTSKPPGLQTVYSTPQDGKCHTEPVAQLTWLTHLDAYRRESYQLVSVGGDGKTLVFDAVASRDELTLNLVGRHLSKTKDLRDSGGRKRATIDIELGITSVSFSCENNTTFISGTDSGGIVKCALKSDVPRLKGVAAVDLGESSPVQLAFQPHGGPVYSVACSPFHRNFFLTASTDGTVRLYSHLETSPLLIMEPSGGYLFDVEWSQNRPLVFWVSTSDGKVAIYDLAKSQMQPVTTLEANTKGLPVFCTARNEQRHRYLATGDGGGTVKVWNLSDELTKSQSNELEQLEKFQLLVGGE